MQKATHTTKTTSNFPFSDGIKIGFIEGVQKSQAIDLLQSYGFDLENLRSSAYGNLALPINSSSLNFFLGDTQKFASHSLILIFSDMEDISKDILLDGDVLVRNKYFPEDENFKTVLLISSGSRDFELCASLFSDITRKNYARLHQDKNLYIPLIIVRGDKISFEVFAMDLLLDNEIDSKANLIYLGVLQPPKKSSCTVIPDFENSNTTTHIFKVSAVI